MYSAKNATLSMNGKTMNYVTFGKGKQPLVILPGLGDGLQTVMGMAHMLALTYREFAKVYKVYVFSRINELPENYTTRNMAADVAEAMETLNLDAAYVIGISQGGMIAQWLAVDFPEKVQRLILAVTTAKPSQLARERIEHWQKLSQSGNLSISCLILQSTPTRKRAIKSGACFIMSWETLVVLKINNVLLFRLYLV